MARVKVPEKLWKVTTILRDRFSGPEVMDREYFDNEEEARAAADKVNSKKTAKEVPECYLTAEVERC